jgi:hypothetical protein
MQCIMMRDDSGDDDDADLQAGPSLLVELSAEVFWRGLIRSLSTSQTHHTTPHHTTYHCYIIVIVIILVVRGSK